MLTTTTYRDLPDEEDKTLFLVMDGESNLTGDPATIDRMLERRETTEVRIIRLLASKGDSDSNDDDPRPKVKLTVEEILPELPDEEGKTGDSAVPPDFVDPLSQLDTEQMRRLKKALASEQAKQILGDNVTAMLDVLSVDDNPTVFLQNSIRRDHCYTPLSPSSDPKGASFVAASSNVETVVKRGKGRPPKVDGTKASGSGLCQPVKPTYVPTSSTTSDAEPTEDVNDVEYQESSGDSGSDRDRSSDSDYRDPNSGFAVRGRRRGGSGSGRRIRGTGQRGRPSKRGRPRRERRPSEEDARSPSPEDADSTLPAPVVTSPAVNVPGKRGRPRKGTSSFKPVVASAPAPAPVSTPEEAVVTPIDHAAAKVHSANAIRLGRPSGKTDEERRQDMARILNSLDAGRGRKVIFVAKGGRPTQPAPATGAGPVHASKAAPVSSVKAAAGASAATSVKAKDTGRSVDRTVELGEVNSTMEPGEIIFVRKAEHKTVRTYVRRESSSKEVKDGKPAGSSMEEVVAVLKPAAPAPATPPAPVSLENAMGGKYPRRENRKLPSHFANTVIPELFSAPDIARKKANAGDDSLAKVKASAKPVQKSLLRYVRKSASSPPASDTPAAKGEEPAQEVVVTENIVESHVDDLAAAVSDLQSMLEEGLDEPTESAPEQVQAPVEVKTEPAPKVSPVRSEGRTRKVSEKEKSAKKLTERRRSSGKRLADSQTEAMAEVKNKTATSVDVPQASNLLQAENIDLLLQNDGEEISINESIVSAKPVTSRSSKDGVEGRGTSNETKSSASVRTPAANEKANAEATKEGTPVRTAEDLDESSAGSEERRRNAVKRRRSDEVSDLDSDLDDTLSEASWNSEDDPERLWCICRKPHNNRFMICCDVCEDWFHGKCVGITKSLGKQMEQDGLEWTCPPCTKKKRVEEKEKETKLISKPGKGPELKQAKLAGFAIKRPSTEEARKCIMCKGPVRENSIYCSDDCIRRHSQRAIAQFSSATKPAAEPTVSGATPAPARREESRIIVMDPTSKKVLTGPNAPTIGNLSAWLQKNPSYHVLYEKKLPPGALKGDVKRIVQMTLPASKVGSGSDVKSSGQLKLTVSPNSKHVKIISRVPGQLHKPAIAASSKKQQIIRFLKAEVPEPQKTLDSAKKTQVIRFPKAEVPEPPKAPEKKVVEPPKPPRRRKEKLTAMPEFKSPTMMKVEEQRDKGSSAGEQAIRDSVRKTLCDALKARLADSKDLDKEQDVDALAVKIEDRLYRHFENKVDVKYKSKYRSLVFNIKDQKNETLYRKILENSISPKQLVRLTPDEMASQELAQWREKENQHQLEIIKKTELELMTQGQTFIIKSRKGEEVIEKDLKVAAAAAEIDPNTTAQELVSALNSVSSTTPDTLDVDEQSRDGETSLMKMKKKEKERRREKERKHKRDRDRSRRSSSRSRTSKRTKSSSSSSRKRSRSRSRDRHRRSRDSKDSKTRSSRHSRDSRDNEKEKDSKEKKDNPEEEQVEISTSEDVERKIKEPTPDEADYEPTSTVTIKTPEPFPEEQEPDEPQETDVPDAWSGQIVMADVAKFHGKAMAASGKCSNIHIDVGDKISVVGRIHYDPVWDYMTKTKGSGTKDISILQILPAGTAEDRASFSTLWTYLSKRSRIGVIGRINEIVKDFYLYPHHADALLPAVLQPLTIPHQHDRGHILLGIIVRSKRGVRTTSLSVPKGITGAAKQAKAPSPATRSKILPLPLPETLPEEVERSYTPPPPEKEVRADPRKRKIRVQVKLPDEPPLEDDDDAPYSPGSADEHLLPLKVQKKTHSNVSAASSADATALAEAVQIQKKIEEMNRAIEKETQQIQTLSSAVPLVAALQPPVATLTAGIPEYIPSAIPAALPNLSLALQALKSIVPSAIDSKGSQGGSPAVDLSGIPVPEDSAADAMQLDIPLPPSPPVMALSCGDTDDVEPYSPSGAISPELEAPPPPTISMPQVAQISIPSNLQEILASIKQSTAPPVANLASPPPSPPLSPPLSPPPSPPMSPPSSPQPLPPGVDDLPKTPPPASRTPKPKPDRTAVFESDGVPQFVAAKSKLIKFDLKLKARDLDERAVVPMDVDERSTPIAPAVDLESVATGGSDRDERVLGSSLDRDQRTIGAPDEVVLVSEEPGTARDRDDRALDEPMVVAHLHHDRDRKQSTSSDMDDRRRRSHGRRKSDSTRPRPERQRDYELEAEWDGSIRKFEDEYRKRNRDIREKEIERLKRRSESDSE